MKYCKEVLFVLIMGCNLTSVYPFSFSSSISSPRSLALSRTKQSQPRIAILNDPFMQALLIKTRKSKFNSISTHLYNQKLTDEDNNDFIGKKTIDRAPCFDSLCISEPEDTATTQQLNVRTSNENEYLTSDLSTSNENSGGEAILRLGGATGPTVWSEFGRLAQENKVANLGQGFPDWLPPKFALDSLVEAATDTVDKSPHQYTRTAGHVSLVKMLAERYSSHLKRNIEAMSEVAVTVGASQALYLSLQTLLKPGDEVILFEPFFDLYMNQVKLAGGTPVFVPLTFVPYDSESSFSGGEWVLEPQRLREAITPKTRAIILNSPHNPTGKLFTHSEMESIASALEEKASDRCVVLSDEVYKYIIHSPAKDETPASLQQPKQIHFDNESINHDINIEKIPMPPAINCPGHTHFASLPNMYERTITISSAGKTFSATGWQVGWCIGPPNLIGPIHRLLPYVQFCASTVIQETLARTLEKAELPYLGFGNYYEYLIDKYRGKRDLLASALRKAGFGIPDYDVSPGGGFFIFARIGPDMLKALPKERLMNPNPAAPGGVARTDWALCQWMAEEKGILCIPSSPFFSQESVINGASDEFVRIAFCKTDETIEEASRAFMRLSGDSRINDDTVAEQFKEDEVGADDIGTILYQSARNVSDKV